MQYPHPQSTLETTTQEATALAEGLNHLSNGSDPLDLSGLPASLPLSPEELKLVLAYLNQELDLETLVIELRPRRG